MDTSSLGVFVAASVALLIVPGPAVLYIVGRSLRHGRAAGFLSVLGICTGTLLHVVAAALGLTAVLRTSPLAFSAIRYAGAAYLVWLGVRALRSDERSIESAFVPHDGPFQIFRQGVIVNLLNPKTALFFLAFLPQFVNVRRGSVGIQVLVLGTIFACMGFMTDSSWGLLAGAVANRLKANLRFRSEEHTSELQSLRH